MYNFPKPVTPLSVQYGAPHLGSHDSGLQHSTLGLWFWHGLGSRRSWCWPQPTGAPTATRLGVGTEILGFDEGGAGDIDFIVPWMPMKGASGIAIDMVIGSASYGSQLKITANGRAMATAITAVFTGAETPVALNMPMPRGAWPQDPSARNLKFGPVALRIEWPDPYSFTNQVDASGMTGIVFQTEWVNHGSFDPYASEPPTYVAKLYSLYIKDIAALPVL